MKRSGIATFTLDYGKCPAWLFRRMVKLGREIMQILVAEYGPDEFIKRIADPVWFQSLGTVLAFDWNASGLTTILTAALKEAIRGQEKDLGIFIAGGKGKTSRKTPDEIMQWGEKLSLSTPKTQSLVYSSKMAAKVDSALIQDGFQIYHHSFFFAVRQNQGKAEIGAWAVVQQGMNIENQTARRYHWYSDQTWIDADNTQINADDQTQINADYTQINADNISVNHRSNQRESAKFNFVCEPHTGIISDMRQKLALNLTAQKSEKTREISTELVKAGYHSLIKDIQLLRKHSSELHKMLALKISAAAGEENIVKLLKLENIEFNHHPVELEDFSKSKYLEKILWQVCEQQPENYEKLLAIQGVGPKTIRALALVAEIIYGAQPSYDDPARYSFAHGGKDATPYPVDKKTYDQTIAILKNALQKTKLPFSEKRRIISRL